MYFDLRINFKGEYEMKITLEQIDLVRKRTNASYKEAKEALERFDGDVVEALAYLDESGKAPKTEFGSRRAFMDKVRDLIHKGNITKFLVTKDSKTVLNIPLNLVIILALVGNYVFAAALLIALVLGYKFNIVSPNEQNNMSVVPKNPESSVQNQSSNNENQ